MATSQDNEDEQWLGALAGKPDPAADPAANIQAEALRRALQAQLAKLDQGVPEADDSQYQQILFRLRREGLLKADHETTKLKRLATAALGTSFDAPRRLQFWAVAATVVIGIGVVFQLMPSQLGTDEQETLRGGGNASVLIVPDPEMRLSQMLVGLRAAGEEPTIKRGAGGQIELRVNGSVKVLDYLATERIYPTLAHGNVELVLQPMKSRP
jgi:hypothetical protein